MNKLILKNIIECVSLIGPVTFDYQDISYDTSTPTIEDFVDDSYQYLLYKKVSSIEPITTEYGFKMLVRLND